MSFQKIWLLVSWLLTMGMGGVCTNVRAQTVVQAEYFFDQDPGQGNGQNLPITGGSLLELNIDIPTTGLAAGTHTLFLRFKDSEGRWSLMEGRQIFIDQEQSVTSPSITQAEYFFDTDPGLGKGTNIPLTTGKEVNLTTNLATDNLNPGVHTLFLRFKDSEGRWSLMEGRLLHIQDLVGTLPQLSRIEYFFDETNPERGKATPISFAPGSIVELDEKIDIAGLVQGKHLLNLRAQDQLGNWSTLEVQDFTITEPRIDTITPASGGNIGDVTINILGASFDEGTKVKFVSSGKPEIVVPDSLMSIFNGEQIQATVDLRGKAIGEYNVIVTLNSGQELTIPNGFTVVEGVAAHPWAEVIGFDRIRIGQWQTYTLVYGNKGNVDAHGVPVWFAVSDTVEVKLDFEFEHPYQSFNVPFDTMYDSISDYIITDTVRGYIGKKKLIGIYIPSISGNSTKTLSFRVKVNSSDPIQLIAWADEPLFGSPLKGWASECLNDLMDLALGIDPITNCLNNAWNTGYEAGDILYKAFEKEPRWGYLGAGLLLKMPAVFASNLIDCAVGPVKAITKVDMAIKMAIKFTTETLKGGGVGGVPIPGTGGLTLDLLKNCLPPPDEPKPPRKITPVTSFDPNDKLGLEGAGLKKYIKGNEVFPYLIRFENKPTATAAAQTVLIIDTLDKEKLDLASLQLGFMSFNDRIINVPPGRKNYTSYVDLRPAQDLIVKIEAKLDEATGVLTWLYSSLDPATRKLTENPDAGFLPPNKTAPEGEGGVFFTIRPKNDLITNTAVKNKAYIYFDNNEVIPTPIWSNAIDKLPPVSQVTTLPQFQTDSTFTVRWSGQDEGAGIDNYSIYVSVNNKPFVVWLNKTTLTSYDFEGKVDSTYRFYSVAQDSTGIVEAAPATADATTTIAKITGLEDELSKKVKVYPNPAVHSFTVELPQALRKSTLTLMNARGTIVSKLETNNRMEVNIKVGQYAKGLYVLQISDGKSIVTKKIMIQ